MFCLMDSGLKCFKRIVFIDRNNFCRQYRTIVHAFIGDEMNHDASVVDLATLIGFEGTLDGVCPREGIGQGGVEVDDSVWKRGKKRR